MWTIILSIINSLLGIFGKKDERDIAEQTGENLGVAKTQAATAQQTVKEATDATKTQDDVRNLSDDDLDRELRGGA